MLEGQKVQGTSNEICLGGYHLGINIGFSSKEVIRYHAIKIE